MKASKGYLSQLMLLRNDPDLFVRVHEEALGGDIDAQYALGLMYAEGRGVEQDDVTAYVWLTIAVDRGDQDAELLRSIVASNLSSEQIDTGYSRAKSLQAELLHGRPGTRH
jgi:TPR repeat protein